MCRLRGYCSRGSAPVASLLTEEGLRDSTALAAFYSDGWSLARYNTDGPHGPEVRGAAQGKTTISGRGRPACGWPPGGQSGRRCRTTRDEQVLVALQRVERPAK